MTTAHGYSSRLTVSGRRIIEGSLIGITVAERVKVWRFPQDRFIAYGPEDERTCRYFGIGEEVEEERSLTLPNCVVTSVKGGKDREIEVEFRTVAMWTEVGQP